MKTTTDADAAKERTALLSISTDLLLITPSVIVAVLANSLILYTDLFGDLNVFLANVILWMILHRIRKGMGVSYDYGVGKMENLLGVIGAWFVMLTVGFIMYTSIGRLFAPVPLQTEATLMGALVMVVAMAAYGYLWVRNYRISKLLPSPVNEMQWRIPMSNTLISGGILLTLGAVILFREYRWSHYIDPVVSLIMGAFISYSFFGLIKTSLFDLLDRTLEENYQLIIVRELAAFYHDYDQLHGVRSRRTGGKVFIEIFLEFGADRRMGEVQQTVEAMRASLEEKIENSSVSISLATKPLC